MTVGLFLLFMIVGALAGTLSGLLGVGGGLIVVPCLKLIYTHKLIPDEYVMHTAAGTSLAAMVVTTFISLQSHRFRGVSVRHVYRRLVAGVVIGTVSGAMIADHLPTHVLSIIFGVIVLLIAIRFFVNVQPKPTRKLPGPLMTNGVSFLIGAKSGMLGLGGGVVTIPFLTRCNVPMRQAIAVSAATSFTIACVGTLSVIFTGANEIGMPAWSTGYIYWPAVFGIILTSPFFAILGSWLSYRLPVKILKKGFAVMLFIIAVRMLITRA